MTTYDDIFPQSAEELQKEAQSIRERHEEEHEQAERILHEFLTAAAEIKKICEAHDKCGPSCPFYAQHCVVTVETYIDTDGMDPYEWQI